jgi:hypothetical protein
MEVEISRVTKARSMKPPHAFFLLVALRPGGERWTQTPLLTNSFHKTGTSPGVIGHEVELGGTTPNIKADSGDSLL